MIDMDMRETLDGIIIDVKVRPGSSAFCLHSDGRLDVKSPPVSGKANREIVRDLGRMLGCEVRILKGMKSSRKTILLKGISRDDFIKRVVEI